MESLRALLLGGIAFETPTTGQQSEVSAENHEFPLFVNQDAAKAASYSRKIPLLVYFCFLRARPWRGLGRRGARPQGRSGHGCSVEL